MTQRHQKSYLAVHKHLSDHLRDSRRVLKREQRRTGKLSSRRCPASGYFLTRSLVSLRFPHFFLTDSWVAMLHRIDPDIVVGHQFLGVSLDVLLQRSRDLKADHWSRLGRFRRAKWPSIGRQGTNIKFLSGRLLCDLASEGAKV